MEKLKDLHESAKNALKQLKACMDIINKEKYLDIHEQLRSATIHSFEYNFECLWKLLKMYIEEVHRVPVKPATPNKTFRVSNDLEIVSNKELEILFDSTEDRNLTTHTYIEEVAKKINKRIPEYYETMKAIVSRLEV